MKFNQVLKDQRLSEWGRAYINYSALKKLIKRAVESRQGKEAVDSEDQVARDLAWDDDIEAFPGNSRRSSDAPISERSRPHSITDEPDQIISRTSTRTNDPDDAAPQANLRFRRKGGAASTIKGHFRFQPQPISELMPQLNAQERKFFTALYSELDKVSAFYNEREAEASHRLDVLSSQLEELEQHRQIYHESRGRSNKLPLPKIPKMGPTASGRVTSALGRLAEVSKITREREYSPPARQFRPEAYAAAKKALKTALLEEYKLINYIKSYRLLNRTGFSKILKKFEKSTDIPCSQAFMKRVNQSNFVQSTKLDELTSKVEDLFATHLTQGNRKRALERLRYTGHSKTHHFATARAGFWLGASVFPFVAGLYLGIRSNPPDKLAPHRAALLQLFGAFSLPVIFSMLVSVNFIVWSAARINYPLIFELDDRNRLDYREFLELPAAIFCMLSYCFWAAMSDFWPNTLQPWNWAYAWFVATLVVLLNPFPGFHVNARWWFIGRLGRLSLSGITNVAFADFWLGDQLVSQNYFLQNLGFMVCTWHRNFDDVPQHCNTSHTWASPVLASLPSMFRAGQSLRRFRDSSGNQIHLLNFGKYSASVVFYFFYFNWRMHDSVKNYTFALMILFAVINSVYSCLWDLLLDWNLFKPRARYRFLRNDLAYRDHVWCYYVAIVADVILRFSFILYVFDAPALDTQVRGFVVGLLEIIRRWLWNFFRLESEHIGNADGYRITRDVPLPYTVTPTSTLKSVLEEQDDEDDALAMEDEEADAQAHPLKRFKYYINQRKSPRRKSTWRDAGADFQVDSTTSDGDKADGETDVASSDERVKVPADLVAGSMHEDPASQAEEGRAAGIAL